MTREEAKITFLNTYQDDNFIEKEFPQIRDKYWFVWSDGDCCFDEWEDNGIHLDRLFLGNVFRTEKEAKQHAKELKAEITLKREIKKINGNWKPNWLDYTNKYYIRIKHENKTYESAYETTTSSMSQWLYLKDKKSAQYIINNFKDELATYFGIEK